MKHKSIFIAVAVVAVTLIIGFGASAQTKSATPKVDSRLVGYWGEVMEDGRVECITFVLNKDGTGSFGSRDCVGTEFTFTTVSGRIKIGKGRGCEGDDCWETKPFDMEFSFSDDGKTLNITGKNGIIKYVRSEKWCC